MSDVFSDYVARLGPGGEPPDMASYEEVREGLRAVLVGEMRRRGLWHSPPSFLGVSGARWGGDALDELVSDAYVFIFVRRLRGLRNQLRLTGNIRPMMILNVRNFLTELQMKADPLGYRVFGRLRKAVERGVARGQLFVLNAKEGAKKPRLGNGSLIGFHPGLSTVAARADLKEPVRRWNDPVELLMIEENAGERARVVLVDEHPYTGSLDLELSFDSLGGAGVVRCDLDAWLDISELAPELRTGALTEMELGRVRRKRRAIKQRTLESSLLEEVVDGDPEYVQWRSDTLQPALDALTGRADEEEGEVGDTVPGWRRWRFAVAVAVLLALALPLGWQACQLSLRLDREEVRVAELEKERRLLAERLAAAEADRESSGREVGRLEAALSDAMEASKRALAEQQERLNARLRGAFDRSVVVNVPSYVLGKLARTRSGRGEPELINPGGAGRFTLSLEVPDPEPYPRYRLRIVDKADGGEVWKTDKLVKVGGKWLRLDLPSDLFETGEYEFRIYGLGSDGPKSLKERYVVKVER